jgi:Na+-translocating ferredoxin:NAD+ oxidoreductase RnfG subunit
MQLRSKAIQAFCLSLGVVLELGAAVAPTPHPADFKDEVYLTLPEALERVFGKGAEVVREEFPLSRQDKDALEKRLGRKLPETSFTVHRGSKDGKFLGDAVVTEEIGLFKTITFMVHIQPNGKVGQAAVMTYREPRGMEVRRTRFLKQYEGKGEKDPIALNRDIVNITGATLSSRALSAGVKKVLHFIVGTYRPVRPLPPGALPQ